MLHPILDSDSRAGHSSAPNVEAGSALDWLISPFGRQSFFNSYWEQRPLVVNRDQPDYFSRLLSLKEVDRVLTTLGRRYPDVTLKNASRPVSEEDYTVGDGALDVAKVYQLFAEGSTITLAFLDTVVPDLTLFCRRLESEFSFPFQANIYLTPPHAQGAKPHYDTHDVFVLQAEGSKEWTLFGTPLALPLPGQDFDPAVHEKGASTLQFRLNAGDVAYLPRGVIHEACSTGTVSLHITVGILRYTWADLLLEFVAGACLQDPAFRKALPPSFAQSDFARAPARETLRDLLQQVWDKSNFDRALDRFVDEFIAACPPILEGQLAQMAALNDLSIDSVAGARPGVICRLDEDADFVRLDCYGRKITLPSYAHKAIRFAVTNPRYVVRDLPGNLDDAGKLTLLHRLIREGLVIMFANSPSQGDDPGPAATLTPRHG